MRRLIAFRTVLIIIVLLWNSPGAGASIGAAGEADRGVSANGPACAVRADAETIRIACEDVEWVTARVPRVADTVTPVVTVEPADGSWHHVRLRWRLDEPVRQDEVAIAFGLRFGPDFHWMPHLAPSEGMVMDQLVFRSPAIVAVRDDQVVAIVPDLDRVPGDWGRTWWLDLDAPAQTCWLGTSKTDIVQHTGFRKVPGMTLPAGELELAFFVTAYRDGERPVNPWGRVSRFLWERWGRPEYQAGAPTDVPMDRYVRRTYDWAFGSWKDAVWQEFELDGRRVGAPQFIVNVTQSPNYPGPWSQREFLSIWNQAWFSSLRSASGLARWARRTGDAELRRKATLTKELALAAPMKDGIFPAVIATHNEAVEVDGRTVRRPRPWSEAFWTNSNRCPRDKGITPEWYHVLDASWTALLMLRWHEEIEPDPRLLEYAGRYAQKLLSLQDEAGFFPAWLHPETHEPATALAQSPETSMSVTFLLKLSELTGEERYRKAALKAMDALLDEVVPTGRWEDYETYWSCCSFGQDHVGRKFERNNMYKQNSLSMFWTAEALLAAYRTTGEHRYLRWGRRTLDELSMCQQVWKPPFIYVPALGGFGVMNFDSEWNDSRQSLFAELFMEYYRETGDAHLFERGVAALKSSFIMMYCPENPMQKSQWEKAHPFFGPADYGFMMENYAHGSRTSPEGMGIGTFTIYDWGNGAASEARNRIRDHFGDVYIDRPRLTGFGIDSVDVRRVDGGYALRDQSTAAEAREIRIVFEDGSSRNLRLSGEMRIAD
jgi:hypothetical protein